MDLLSPLDYRVTLLLFLGGGRGASGGFEAHHRSTLSSSYMHRWQEAERKNKTEINDSKKLAMEYQNVVGMYNRENLTNILMQTV